MLYLQINIKSDQRVRRKGYLSNRNILNVVIPVIIVDHLIKLRQVLIFIITFSIFVSPPEPWSYKSSNKVGSWQSLNVVICRPLRGIYILEHRDLPREFRKILGR